MLVEILVCTDNLGGVVMYLYYSNAMGLYIHMCIYMFMCTELIEETGKPLGLFFDIWGYF